MSSIKKTNPRVSVMRESGNIFRSRHRPFINQSLLSNGQCRFHHYRLKDVVKCLDNFNFTSNLPVLRPVRFAFVGDSTIRNQFFSFMRVL